MSKRTPKFLDVVNEIARMEGRSPLEAFRAVILCSACALSMGQREPEYLEEIGRWPKSVNVFGQALGQLIEDMETAREPFCDLVGPLYMEIGSKSTRDWGGEFYTPSALSKAMAKMLMPSRADVPKDRVLTVQEPASGAGSMVLALADHMVDIGLSPLNMRVTCVDVSKVACDMCFVNMSLWGIPAEVIHGNTLSLEIKSSYRTWCWYLARPAYHDDGRLEATIEDIVARSVAAAVSSPVADQNGQFKLFDFTLDHTQQGAA